MPAFFDQGFMVREPAWHGLGVVLADFPGRDEAMRLAGHDFTVVERPLVIVGNKMTEADMLTSAFSGEANVKVAAYDGEGGASLHGAKPALGWKALIKSGTGDIMHVVKDSYTVIQNDTAWDVVDAIVGAGAKYETGLTLKGGAVCCVLAWLDEPVTIPGDDSTILPWVNVAWTHDGSGALTARSTNIRTVCSNTQSASEAQGQRLGTDFTFRHTRNVMDRIEEAKQALKGVRAQHAEYLELATELARIPITPRQREIFVNQFIPMPPDSVISDRTAANVEDARNAVRALFEGATIPEAHRFTAYGLHLAGGEYLDHIRGWRSKATYFGRSMLRNEPAKTKLTKLIREVTAA